MSESGSGGVCRAFLGRVHRRRRKRDSVFSVRWLRMLLHYEAGVPLSAALSFLFHLVLIVDGIMQHFSSERLVSNCCRGHEVVTPASPFLCGAIHQDSLLLLVLSGGAARLRAEAQWGVLRLFKPCAARVALRVLLVLHHI